MTGPWKGLLIKMHVQYFAVYNLISNLCWQASIDRKHVFKWWDAAILDEFEDLRHLV